MKTLIRIKLCTALLALTALNIPTQVIAAGPTITNPGQLDAILESVNNLNKFETKIDRVNNRIHDLLKKVAEMQELNKDPNLIIVQINNTYKELQNIINLDVSDFRMVFTRHIASLIKLAVEKNKATSQASYRASAHPGQDNQSAQATDGNYSSTRRLAHQLTNGDIATLTLMGILGASINATHDYNSRLTSKDYRREMGAVFISIATMLGSLPMAAIFDIQGYLYTLTALSVPAVSTGLLTHQYWKRIGKPRVIRTLETSRNKEFNTSIDFFVNSLQEALGETAAAPLIAAIRSGDTDAIHSAACQYALTPRTVPQVRIETETDVQQAEQAEVQHENTEQLLSATERRGKEADRAL